MSNFGTRSKIICRVGALAALIAALGFRRNMGAEMTMFFGATPTAASGWFTLLQDNPLLGIISLNFFDIINYALVSIMFVALFFALRKTRQGLAASLLCLGGFIVYVVSDTSFEMVSLSNKYATASTAAQKSALLAAGQAILAKGVPGAGYEGIGGVVSMLLIAVAGLIISIAILQSKIFNRITGYLGIIASVFDLVYLMSLGSLPVTSVLWSSILVGGAGLLLTVWHILIGIRLYRLSNMPNIKVGVNP